MKTIFFCKSCGNDCGLNFKQRNIWWWAWNLIACWHLFFFFFGFEILTLIYVPLVLHLLGRQHAKTICYFYCFIVNKGWEGESMGKWPCTTIPNSLTDLMVFEIYCWLKILTVTDLFVCQVWHVIVDVKVSNLLRHYDYSVVAQYRSKSLMKMQIFISKNICHVLEVKMKILSIFFSIFFNPLWLRNLYA